MPSAALLGAGGARDADVAEQVLPGDTSPPELKLLGLGVHPGDALLEAAAGADVSVDLCHAPEFTLMQRLPQHGNDSLFALFHTPRLWNGRDAPAGQLSSMTGVDPPVTPAKTVAASTGNVGELFGRRTGGWDCWAAGQLPFPRKCRRPECLSGQNPSACLRKSKHPLRWAR